MKPAQRILPAALAAVLLLTASCADGLTAPEADLTLTDRKEAVAISPASASNAAFGPIRVERTKGLPAGESVSIAIASLDVYEQPLTLHIRNGDEDCSIGGHTKSKGTPCNRVSSAEVSLDGVVLFSPQNFNPHTELLEVDVTIEEGSVLAVRLNGSPGSFLDVWIEGEMVAAASCPCWESLADITTPPGEDIGFEFAELEGPDHFRSYFVHGEYPRETIFYFDARIGTTFDDVTQEDILFCRLDRWWEPFDHAYAEITEEEAQACRDILHGR